MSKAIPVIGKYMSTCPHSIGAEQSLAVAHQMMKEHGFRHLPVLHGGRLVGMLTERDLGLIESLDGVDADQVTAEDAMSTNPYTVSPDAPLDEVLSEMAANKYGSAIVVQNHKVVGIFTTVDVCNAFRELLETRLAH